MLVAPCGSIYEGKKGKRAKPCVLNSLQGRSFDRSLSLWFDRSLSLWFDRSLSLSKCTNHRSAPTSRLCETLANKALLNALWAGVFCRLYFLKGWLAKSTPPQPRRSHILRQHFANVTRIGIFSHKGITDDISVVALKLRIMNMLSLVLASIFRPGRGTFN